MGVKPKYIKDIGTALVKRYPEAVTTDFDHNKKLVDATTNIQSKNVRNRVAGFITRQRSRQLEE